MKPTIKFVDIDRERMYYNFSNRVKEVLENTKTEEDGYDKNILSLYKKYSGEYKHTGGIGYSYTEVMDDQFFSNREGVSEEPLEDSTGIIVTSDLNYEQKLKYSGYIKHPDVDFRSVWGSIYGMSDTISQAYKFVTGEAIDTECNYYEPEEVCIPEDMEFILVVVPIINDKNKDFRPHKWGEYVGNRLSGHECLYDEDVDMIYYFNLIPVKKVS